jgi:hypothetical protein
MATTTNYGWTTPDDTDLVKDGAAAIRTLGSSVDTTTKALNPETTEGDIAYRSATANTNTRLALGTAGQVLTVNSGEDAPEWATPAGGSDFVRITSQSFSASAAVNVNDVFSATYKNYKVFINVATASGAANIFFRYRVGGADNSTSNYAYQRLILNATTFNNFRATGEAQGTLVDSSTVNNNQELTFFNPFESKLSYVHSAGTYDAGTPAVQLWHVGFNATTSFTGFTIYPGSSTITGEILVYGMKV